MIYRYPANPLYRHQHRFVYPYSDITSYAARHIMIYRYSVNPLYRYLHSSVYPYSYITPYAAYHIMIYCYPAVTIILPPFVILDLRRTRFGDLK